MGKKKITGQTITIIILVILLILVIGFGGVYAYYSSRSNKVSGKVVMANLNISLTGESGVSGSSNLIMTSGYVMPGQSVSNNPLTLTNKSNTETYIVVVYKVEGFVSDDLDTNIIESDKATLENCGYDQSVWTNYHYVDSLVGVDDVTYTADFWCLISLTSFSKPADTGTGDLITVIGENSLKVPSSWGNEFQDLVVSFSFQAYAIGSDASYGTANSLRYSVEQATTVEQKCNLIASAVWCAFDYNITL